MERKKAIIFGICVRLACILFVVLFANEAFAAAGTAAKVSLTGIEGNVTKGVVNLAKMIKAIALVAGIGFVLASFFKFHQHKLNPQQIPLSHGITLLVIGAGLSLFPDLIQTMAQGVFGTTTAGSITALVPPAS